MKSNIKWTESCLECQAEHGGICESEDCAKLNYDPWGDKYPLWVFSPDHDGREEYIAQKRKRIESKDENL